MRKRWQRCVVIWCVFLMSTTMAISCGEDAHSPRDRSALASEYDGDHARAWMDEILVRIRADAISPPVASRLLGYAGVGIYESSVQQMPEHRSMGGQLRMLPKVPPANGGPYDVPTVIHATLGYLMPVLFESEESREHLTSFAEDAIEARGEQAIDTSVIRNSLNRGRLLAQLLDARALRDGYYGRNSEEFDPPKDGPSAWVPVGDQEPLEPYWSDLEPFALPETDACSPPGPAEFSTQPDSEFYRQAMEVYEATPQAGSEEETIALFWADNPGESSTPPGHWMALAGQMVEDRQLGLGATTEMYGLLGVAVADAFISCWDEKYRHYLIRPVSYIRRHIDPNWETTIATPPFPEYTSGHSTVSGASARVLTDVLGEFSFEDRTGVDRGLQPRQFDDFEAAADEAVVSRLYGGVHYPMANNRGMWQGECVGETVLDNLETRNE